MLFLFTGLHADYHRPSDTADKINYAGLETAVTIGDRLVTAMAAMPRQAYNAAADGTATMALASGHATAPGRRAALGVVPDFSSFEARGGVAISGVTPGTPADVAGLTNGDVLTNWNDRPLSNLQDLSDDLADASPGQTVRLQFDRGGKKHDIRLVLSARNSD